jgi:hypothetical protein
MEEEELGRVVDVVLRAAGVFSRTSGSALSGITNGRVAEVAHNTCRTVIKVLPYLTLPYYA